MQKKRAGEEVSVTVRAVYMEELMFVRKKGMTWWMEC